MAATYLDAILNAHRDRARRDRRVWQERAETLYYQGPSFLEALRSDATTRIKVIAEVKRRSPSKGWIDRDLDPVALVRSYESGGASAVSVLTDEDHFAGSSADLSVVRANTVLPVLRKDFTVSENDVLDAAQMGAGAVLLIVAALEDDELRTFLDLAHRVNLDALVEVHDAHEARRATDVGARIVGVNQRDLRNFEVDEARATALVSALDPTAVRVAESGITSVSDVQRTAHAGFDAVLVGEAFVRSSDPAALVREFASVTRSGRD
jgi:indole-3-glycerol phosphate synthase